MPYGRGRRTYRRSVRRRVVRHIRRQNRYAWQANRPARAINYVRNWAADMVDMGLNPGEMWRDNQWRRS